MGRFIEIFAFSLLPIALSLGGCDGEPRGCVRLPGCEALPVCCGVRSMCAERVCQGVSYICSRTPGGYAWVERNARCDDGNRCTDNDSCFAGECRGTTRPCQSPPSNRCLDSTLLLSYSAHGSCDAKTGRCSYPEQRVRCPKSCSGGKCTGKPCLGVKCDAPPACRKAGSCEATTGKCRYDTLASAGATCKATDPCLTGSCDSSGRCRTSTKDCSRPHTTGGTCKAGICGGYSCASGYANCNADWKDGCEAKLGSTSACGGCNKCGAQSICVSNKCRCEWKGGYNYRRCKGCGWQFCLASGLWSSQCNARPSIYPCPRGKTCNLADATCR